MLTTDRSILAELPCLLSWNKDSDALRMSCSIYVNWVYQRMHAWSNAGYPELWQMTRNLSRESQRRLLLAPQTYHLLQSTGCPSSEQVEAMVKFIEAEKLLSSDGSAGPIDAWTALGDHYFGGRDGTDSAGEVKAPSVHQMVLDVYSPFCTLHYPSPYGTIHKQTEEELGIIVPRIQRSLDQIHSISPLAAQMVEASVQVLALTKTPEKPNLTCSASLRALIGRMSLINVHSDGWTTAKISNGIVHEAIHSMLYKFELAHDFYTDDAAAHQITTTSPWSGRTLFMHSFVHACFVWFGLWCFWSQSSQDDECAAAFRNRSVKGFVSGSPFRLLSKEAYECIQPDLRLVIQKMFEYVQRNSSGTQHTNQLAEKTEAGDLAMAMEND